jgi:hypothetical protein
MRQRHDRPMYADDMFRAGVQQVFSVRTGEFLGYSWEPRSWEQAKPGEIEPEPIDTNQLILEI